MARGTSIPITTVVINGPMAERSYPSWESDNAVIVKENKTTHSSTWGAKDLCEICIWKKFLRERILLCKVAMMQKRALATACHSQGLWRENALRLVFVNKFDTRFNIRVPFALPNWKPSITLPTTWIFINWTTFNSRTVKEVCFKLHLNNNNNNSGQIWLNFHASFSRFVSQQCRANLDLLQMKASRLNHLHLKTKFWNCFSTFHFNISVFGCWGKTGSLTKTFFHYLWWMALSFAKQTNQTKTT